MLAGYRHSREDAVAATVVGLLAVQGHQFLFGWLAPHLCLELSDRAVHRLKIHRLERTGEGGRTRRRIPAVGVGANAQCPALGLGEFFGEASQRLGSALSAAQHRARHNGQQ